MNKLLGRKSPNQFKGYKFAPYITISGFIIPVKLVGFVNGEPVYKKIICKHNKVKLIYEFNKYKCQECGLKFN